MTNVLAWYRTTIGKKVIVAITGMVWFGYLVAHMVGNLQIFAGRAVINAYAKWLHSNQAMLWTFRVVLIISLALHIAAIVQLYARNAGARGQAYKAKRRIAADYASRTMYLSGPIIAFFLVYHILHLTLGKVGPFDPNDVYGNLVAGFRIWYISALYMVSMVLLSLHLYHGLWSWFQTLGLNHPKYNAARRVFAQAVTAFLILGFVSVPVAVMTGYIK